MRTSRPPAEWSRGWLKGGSKGPVKPLKLSSSSGWAGRCPPQTEPARCRNGGAGSASPGRWKQRRAGLIVPRVLLTPARTPHRQVSIDSAVYAEGLLREASKRPFHPTNSRSTASTPGVSCNLRSLLGIASCQRAGVKQQQFWNSACARVCGSGPVSLHHASSLSRLQAAPLPRLALGCNSELRAEFECTLVFVIASDVSPPQQQRGRTAKVGPCLTYLERCRSHAKADA